MGFRLINFECFGFLLAPLSTYTILEPYAANNMEVMIEIKNQNICI